MITHLDEFLFVLSSWLVRYLYPQKNPEVTQKALRQHAHFTVSQETFRHKDATTWETPS